MLDGKFEPNNEIDPDIQIRLECLRLATEFGPEYDRKDPMGKAQLYYDWVLQKRNSKRQSVKTAKSKV